MPKPATKKKTPTAQPQIVAALNVSDIDALNAALKRLRACYVLGVSLNEVHDTDIFDQDDRVEARGLVFDTLIDATTSIAVTLALGEHAASTVKGGAR